MKTKEFNKKELEEIKENGNYKFNRNKMKTKELRKLIRQTELDKLESLIYGLKKKGFRLQVRRWGVYVDIDDISILDGKIVCYECPAWSIGYRCKKSFSYNVRICVEKEI